jgi:hypothetical protein
MFNWLTAGPGNTKYIVNKPYDTNFFLLGGQLPWAVCTCYTKERKTNREAKEGCNVRAKQKASKKRDLFQCIPKRIWGWQVVIAEWKGGGAWSQIKGQRKSVDIFPCIHSTSPRLSFTYIGDDSVPDCDLVCSIVRVNLNSKYVIIGLFRLHLDWWIAT